MGYTKAEIITRVEKSATDISTLYKCDFINYRGLTTDTNEYYTEVVAEWLLSNTDALNGITPIVRMESYRTSTHIGIPNKPDSIRNEELVAMDMFRQGNIVGLGKVLDYQTPLKNKRSDKAGKIDLLSFENKTLHILELKDSDSSESMLRCALEGYTYLKTACHAKLLESFELPEDTAIKANPLVVLNGHQHNEIKEGRPALSKLMEILDIKPFLFL